MEEKVRFEEAMKKLSEIVDKLESGEGALDEMISLYEEGMKLVKSCEAQLDSYEATIVQLSEAAEAGKHAE